MSTSASSGQASRRISSPCLTTPTASVTIASSLLHAARAAAPPVGQAVRERLRRHPVLGLASAAEVPALAAGLVVQQAHARPRRCLMLHVASSWRQRHRYSYSLRDHGSSSSSSSKHLIGLCHRGSRLRLMLAPRYLVQRDRPQGRLVLPQQRASLPPLQQPMRPWRPKRNLSLLQSAALAAEAATATAGPPLVVAACLVLQL
mmetsp:Transcript_40143/g.100818  ORF Transcript_40143/g.100818 Transcript_40143/m.100818 type:complete len:203 (-) Transcript_40143:477-1085(-)